MKREKQNKLIKIILFTLIILFIIIAFAILSPFEILAKRAIFPFLAFSAIAYFLLGIALVVLTIKSKLKGKQRKYLILTGASASGFFIGAILHNILYALGVLTNSMPLLHYSFEFLHASFFLFAIIACPIGFIIGVIASLSSYYKDRK